jgi:adenosylhomocysteine nucleosidase
MTPSADACILISAGSEWRALLSHFPRAKTLPTSYGEVFTTSIASREVCFFHTGWGKVASAGGTQYAIDRWSPRWLVNLGTCGGVEGLVDVNDIILAQETIIYDIIEGMSSYQAAIEHYAVQPNLDWLGTNLPFKVKRLKLFSADRDIRPVDVSGILRQFGAAAADWESGAFAWVCARNHKDWLVLRTVTDLVSDQHGEALGNADLWKQRTVQAMQVLLNHLPWLIERYRKTHS